jgi:hypothetical protein
MSTPITGCTGFLAVSKTAQLGNSIAGGAWTSSDTAIATVNSVTGLLTGVAAGNVVITYTAGLNVSTLPIQIVALSYTNGFDISRVLPVLVGRKGWKQPTSPNFPFTLNPVNTSCLSGRYFQRDNPACSPEKIFAAQEDELINETNFNALLTDMQVGCVMDGLTAVFRQPSLVEKPQIIFEKTFRTSYQPIKNASKFCGWQMQIADGNYTAKIESISFTATAPCTVTIYLFNDLRSAPIWQQDVTVTVPNDQTIYNLETLYLSRLDDTHKGGVFFFGYFQDQLEQQGAKAADVYLNWFSDPNMFAYQAFEATSDMATLWFRRDQYFSNYRTYGLGVEISTWWDFTNTIIRNAHEFDNLTGMMMVAKCIEEITNSPRSNADMRVTQDQLAAMYETLNGIRYERSNIGIAQDYKTGLKNKIELEVKRIQNTFMATPDVIHSIPPVNATGVKIPTWGHMM